MEDIKMNVLLLEMQVVQGLSDREEAVSHTIQKPTEQTSIVRWRGKQPLNCDYSPTGAYVPEGLMTSCSWDYMTFTPSVRSYTMLLFTFVFFIPLFVIIFSYCCIFRAIRHTTRLVHAQTQTHTHVHVVKSCACLVCSCSTHSFLHW